MYKQKIQDLINEIDLQLIERRSLIRISILAIFARHHIMLFGVPGVGKSYSIAKIIEMVKNQKFFSVTLSQATELNDLIPINPDQTDQEILEDEKCLLSHRFVFLDEMFKGREQLLNALLPVLNERHYAIRGKEYKIPLSTMFCASNEIPSSDFIKPYKDRILFWFDVKPLSNLENKMKYLQEEFYSHKLTKNFEYDEILEVESKVKKEFKKLNHEIAICFKDLIQALRRSSIEISDRKSGTSFILRAFKTSALLNDRTEVNYSDLSLLIHMSWTDLRQKRISHQVVSHTIFGSPTQVKCKLLALSEKINGLFIQYEEDLNDVYDLVLELMIYQFEEKIILIKEFQEKLIALKEDIAEINNQKDESLRRFEECLDNVFIAEEANELICVFKDQKIIEMIIDIENSIDYALLRISRVLEKMPNFILYQKEFLKKSQEF